MPLATVLLLTTLCAPPNHAYPPEIRAWDQAAKDAQRDAATTLLKQFEQAVTDGAETFTIPPGDYRFGPQGPQAFKVVGAHDLTIDATGVTFWFDGRLRVDALQFNGCRNVTLRGLTVDYDPLGYLQGEVLTIDDANQVVDFRIDPGFPLPDETWTKQPGSIKTVFYAPDGLLREFRMDWVKSLQDLGDRVVRVSFTNGWLFDRKTYPFEIAPGDRLCLPDRSMRHAFTLNGSEQVTLEDITIYACSHMALTEVGGVGGHVYRRCKVIRRPGTNRLLACNADVFHSVTVEHGPTIEECEFSHAADDFINLHGFFFLVQNQLSPTEVEIVCQYREDAFSVGSTLRFYRFDDLAPEGSAKVLEKVLIEGDAAREAALKLPAEIRAKGERIRDLHPRQVWAFRVKLDQPVKTARYDFVGCDDCSANGAIIRSNYFHDCYTRGVLLKSSNTLVEGNRFERIGDASLAIAAERYWMEGPFAHDVTIRNNTILDSGVMFTSHNWNTQKLGAITVIAEGAHGLSAGRPNQRIVIEGNRIVRPSAVGIAVLNAQDVVIRDNVIEQPVSRQPYRLGSSLKVKDPLFAIYLAQAAGVKLEGNRVLDPSEWCRGEVGYGPGAGP